MRDLFNLRIDPDRSRSDTDAYLDRDGRAPLPFELKSTTTTSVSTVRDFNPDHVRKWRDKHWLFGFFNEREELQYCCYASPAMMKPWIDQLEAYVRPDIEIAARLGSRVEAADLVAIVGDKEVYSIEDAIVIQKKQWRKGQYAEAIDVEAGYTAGHLHTVLPGDLADALVAALGDKEVYGYAEVRTFLGARWRRSMEPDVPEGYTKTRMLDILRARAKYLLERGATLNNPHINKKFFDGFENITANHAIRVREMVEEAEKLAAEGAAPIEAAALAEAAGQAIPADGTAVESAQPLSNAVATRRATAYAIGGGTALPIWPRTM